MSYITHTPYGSYCDVCGAALGQEEIDWECCDCCGGEGLGDEDDGDYAGETEMDEFITSALAEKSASPQGGKP